MGRRVIKISIQLLFLLNYDHNIRKGEKQNFNTTSVLIKRSRGYFLNVFWFISIQLLFLLNNYIKPIHNLEPYFNTTSVLIKLALAQGIISNLPNFNTTSVLIKRCKKKLYRGIQLISIQLLFLLNEKAHSKKFLLLFYFNTTSVLIKPRRLENSPLVF